MKRYLDRIEENYKKYPNHIILSDEEHPEGITYQLLDDLTGRVHTWLKQNNIGKEDFVLINLPHGILPIIAFMGVWRAGCAFVMVEENYPPERTDFIREDCNCKIEINKNNWEEIINSEYVKGHEKTNLHDAAYSVYTSGTTGKPKGVLHEYGNLDRAMESVIGVEKIYGRPFILKNDKFAIISPLNVLASIATIMYALYNVAGIIQIPSFNTIKNSNLLKKMFIEKKISATFLTPSYVRKINGKIGPFLKTITVCAEPANNLYIEGVDIFNYYGMSECGFAVGIFLIDKPYETCPIGKPTFDLKYMLVDEEGKEVAPGEIGELCFENPYVRGYINLPEETSKVFKNGFYYTGDIAKVDSSGNLIILGRNNDMIKINGNRIEPAEIENAIKNVLGVNWVGIRVFEKKESSYLCAYYTENIKVDSDNLRQELLKILPYYMIPSYFIKIEKVPLNENGKFDRKALPMPNIKVYINKYVAPTNEVEEKICKVFEKVLKLDKVGINDDFYEIGGDSLSSIEVISICDLPGLNVSEIFRARTPKKIARLYINLKNDELLIDKKNSDAMNLEHFLTTEQRYMINYQFYTPKSTMYNLFTMLKIDKEQFEMEEVAKALEVTIKNHPALLTTYHFNEEGKIIQKYTPEIFSPITVEKMSELEFNKIKDTLVVPFKVIDSRLYRARIFETEKAGYLFFDVHHSLFDGTSIKVFMENIRKAYKNIPLEKDYYYLMLAEREQQKLSAFYEKSKKYFEEKYNSNYWSTYPQTDYESRENELGEFLFSLDIKQKQLKDIEKIFKITRNEFFIVVTSLTVSIYNKKENVKISWIYNGRENKAMMTTVGLLIRDLPISFEFQNERTIRDIYINAHKQVLKGIEYSCYPYVENTDQVVLDDVVCLLYQQDIRDSKLEEMSIETIDIRQNRPASQTVIDIEILEEKEGLQILIDYAASRYKEESIKKFKDLFLKIAYTLLNHISQTDITISELKKEIKNNIESENKK